MKKKLLMQCKLQNGEIHDDSKKGKHFLCSWIVCERCEAND